MASSNLLVLQLSDLHFGNKNRYAGQDPKQLGEAFHRASLAAIEKSHVEATIQFVIVSGDLAETGEQQQFDQAREFLESLSGQIGIGPSQFVFVPGNHDLSWPLCEIETSRQKLERFDDHELRQRINAVKFSYYNKFLEQFYGVPS